MENYVLPFAQIDKQDLPIVGGKGANLGEMTKAGFPIPQGFCVTTWAYRAFVQTSDAMAGLFEQLECVQHHDLEQIRELGQRIREHLQSIAMPDAIRSSILQAWQHTGAEKAYAVRSSATAEDLPTASFAGQQDTYLNVCGREQLLDAIQRCWASLFTDRAISYRAKNGFDHRSVFLSVVVQEMVFPEVSGILFTADPISGRRNTISIDASFGLGEALVSGLVSADLYQVRAGAIIKKQVAKKKIAIFAVPTGGTVTEELPPEQQEKQALADEHILELAKWGQKIEAHYGLEQDIEWCLADGRFYIVQSRPITSLFPVPNVQKDHLRVYISFGHIQMMTNAIKPLARSVLRTMIPFGKPDGIRSTSDAFVEAGGRLFADPTDLFLIPRVRKLVPRLLSGVEEQIAAALHEVFSRAELDRTPPNPQVKKTTIRTLRPVLWNVLQNLLFRDPTQARARVEAFMARSLQTCTEQLTGVTGAERIRRIQEQDGQVLASIIKNAIHYTAAGIVSSKLLESLLKKWLGDQESIFVFNKSLPGNVTSEMGLQIGDLADVARTLPEVVAFLETATDETFVEGLQLVEGGTTFLRAWETFMQRYGMRCPGEIDMTVTRWAESPMLLVPAILGHLRTVAPGEHREKFKRGEQEAAQREQEVLARVRQTPFGAWKRKRLARLIKVYRHLMALREHHKYLMVQHLYLYKKAILEEGQTLVRKGILQAEQDVFYLSLDEHLQLAEGRFAGDVQALVVERKKQHERDEKLSPPRVMTSEGEVITGRRRDVQAPAGALVGTPVSAGIMEGYARIVLRPEEAKLNPGEIMVAPFTDPGWTPLFHSAKGLIMEVGGMMTHGAVVAREYGIPAVVGIEGATTLLKDGMRIRLHGTEGYVEILSEQE